MLWPTWEEWEMWAIGSAMGRGDGDDERIGQRIPWWRLERQGVESERLERQDRAPSPMADGSITPIHIAKGRKKDENSPRSGKRNRECSARCESKRVMLRWDR
jgi:hypothetical protein